jgi:ubiquinone/menaquinone biosynthesis C-methylase UbiE
VIVESAKDMYAGRALTEGYPGINQFHHEKFSHTVTSRPDDTPRIEWVLQCLGRLVNLGESRRVLVLGCGPHPQPAQIMRNHGHEVIGVEPVKSFVETARQYLGDSATVLQGSAEAIPLPDGSQDIVVFESVLEHVESVAKSLEEIYRVLAPGGVLYMTTTSRYRFSLRGRTGEYNVPFYNWFPRLVKEGYILEHLHYRPNLANYSQRPAVHWFSFADLCSRGRDAGFARFYSHLDLMRHTDPRIAKSWLRKALLRHIQHNPWVRAIALTQVGGVIFMFKRSA